MEIERVNNRVAAVEETPSKEDGFENKERLQGQEHDQVSGWKKFLLHVGPGFLIAIGYMDPGNLETDLQAGASYKYELLWVILLGLIFAQIIQSLSANLGVATGKHLAEHCKAEYPTLINICLWLLAETSVIAADIPEVIGTAFALNILFHIPVWAGVLITGLSAFLILAVQRYGIRKLELLISVLIFILAGCYFGEMSYINPSASEVVKGLFVPKLSGNGATANAIAILGQTVIPYNLFLHSALVLTRKTPPSTKEIRTASRYFFLESTFAVVVALLVNVAVVIVTGTICNADNISQENADTCNNITLDSAHVLLRNVLGKASSIVYGIALLASGQSSTIASTYAGQFIMQGFLDIKMKGWQRNVMTRGVAIIPSLIVSMIAGSAGAGKLIIISAMVLSFELPFVLIPLMKFSTGSAKMGPHGNSIYIIIIAWILFLAMTGMNVYYLCNAFIGWLLHNSLPKVANVFVGIIVFPIIAIYIICFIYLTFRKDRVTFVDQSEIEMENGVYDTNGNGASGNGAVPIREDLADIPFPE